MRFLLNYPGYVEGWATYVEMISYHYAGLDDDLVSLLSLNQSALLSLYASTDLGIHYDGWSFSDTTAFWKDFGITDQTALREIYELIVEEPAHYLKYYVDIWNLWNLKEKAQETYGSAYSDIAFHKALLSIGPAPFSIMKRIWIIIICRMRLPNSPGAAYASHVSFPTINQNDFCELIYG